ncbi:MAG: hypothetical protein GY849_02080 [Deltaproteobacteria bacterium]|nr:hypothetical protein [Deltaproteobacteria bacterium]
MADIYYNAEHGIGTYIYPEKNDTETLYLVEDIIKRNTKEYELYEIFTTAYDGDYLYCICIKNPFSDGIFGLEKKWNGLTRYLDNNNIPYINEIRSVGGLLM